MRDKDPNVWAIVQAVSGVYCAILGTVSWLFPRQPGQPLWQSPVRVTVPPPFAIGLALLGASIAIPGIIRVARSFRRTTLDEAAVKAGGLDISWKPGEIKYYMFYGASNLTLHYRVCIKNRSLNRK